MCDTLPGYVSTISHKDFNKIKGNLVIVGLEDGKIYSVFGTKEQLFAKLAAGRKRRMRMICYYRDVEFTATEMERTWAYAVMPVSEVERQRIAASWPC